MITNDYVDGFNLYYRALKDTPFRWLDLHKLAATLFPDDTIRGVHYFTARLDARHGHPGQAQRQLIYIRALSMRTVAGCRRRQLPRSARSSWTRVTCRRSAAVGAGVVRVPTASIWC